MNFLHFFTLKINSTSKKKNHKIWYSGTQIINIMSNPGIKCPFLGRRWACHTVSLSVEVFFNVEKKSRTVISMKQFLTFCIMSTSVVIIKLLHALFYYWKMPKIGISYFKCLIGNIHNAKCKKLLHRNHSS